MSGCGCGGGFPPSVALRVRAAELTAHAGVDHLARATAMAEFLRGGKTDADLDAAKNGARGLSVTESPALANARTARNILLGSEVSTIGVSDGVAMRLSVSQGITSVEQLVLADNEAIRSTIGVSGAEEHVQDMLGKHGLRLRMSPTALTSWVFDGVAVE